MRREQEVKNQKPGSKNTTDEKHSPVFEKSGVKTRTQRSYDSFPFMQVLRMIRTGIIKNEQRHTP